MTKSQPAFAVMVARYRAKMATLREVAERDGYLLGVHANDPSYRLFLSREVSSDAPWRVTSFRNGEPVGHREYDVLDGRGPTQNALQEFASDNVVLVKRGAR